MPLQTRPKLRRQLGDERGIGRALLLLSGVLEAHGDFDQATRVFEQARAIFERIGHVYGIASCRLHDGVDARNQGDADRARVLMSESLDLFRQDGFPYGITRVLVMLGNLEAGCGKSADAATHYRESLHLWSETLSQERLVDTIAGAGSLAASCGRPDAAAKLLGVAASLAATLGYAVPRQDEERNGRVVSATRAALGEEKFAAAWAAGASFPLDVILAETEGLLADLAIPSRQSKSAALATPGGLTPRELDVVRLLAAGRSNREIAQDLFVSQSTAISHVRNILAKLDLDSRSAVAAWAVRNGLD